MLTKGILLLQNNKRPHTSEKTQDLINSFGMDILDHPSYSPDLAGNDLQRFRYFKHQLGRKHFNDDKQVMRAMLLAVRQTSLKVSKLSCRI